MTLDKSCSVRAFGRNIGVEQDSGKPREQALAIAFSTLRRACGIDPDAPRMSPKEIVAKNEVVDPGLPMGRGGVNPCNCPSCGHHGMVPKDVQCGDVPCPKCGAMMMPEANLKDLTGGLREALKVLHPPCPKGSKWDPKMNICRPTKERKGLHSSEAAEGIKAIKALHPECPEGSSWDYKAGHCRPDAIEGKGMPYPAPDNGPKRLPNDPYTLMDMSEKDLRLIYKSSLVHAKRGGPSKEKWKKNAANCAWVLKTKYGVRIESVSSWKDDFRILTGQRDRLQDIIEAAPTRRAESGPANMTEFLDAYRFFARGGKEDFTRRAISEDDWANLIEKYQASKEPTQRALDRMDALADRGQDVEQGTLRRLKATKDPGKIQGIYFAAKQRKLKSAAKAAMAKFKQIVGKHPLAA